MFQDGFGARSLSTDPATREPVEILTFTPVLAAADGVASAVGERVARLTRVRHTMYARPRRVDRPSQGELRLFSDHVPGWRLSDVLAHLEQQQRPIDISAIIVLMRQLIPGVTLFSRHQRDATIGTLAPERLVLTPHGRLVITEYALGTAVEQLGWSREQLWRDLRVTVPEGAAPGCLTAITDVIAMGVVAVSLLLGRTLKGDEYLAALPDLVGSLTETSAGKTRPLSGEFGHWLARALQFDQPTAFNSTQEAQVGFEEMLAKELAYVTSTAELEQFLEQYQASAGAPPSPLTPKVASPEPPPVVEAAVAPPPPPVAAVEIEAPPVAASAARPSWLRPAVAALALVALLQAGVIAWMWGGTPDGPGGEGELVVQSRPVAARVSVNGEDRGVTPLTVPLAPGAHVLEVRAGRAEPRVIPIVIKPGTQSGIYVELQSVATVGGLEVRSEPAKARVTVGGQYRGVTPLRLDDLPPGEIDVVVQAGGREVKQAVRIEPGITSQLVIPLGR